MFVLASRFYGLQSETFVVAHAERIAPGRTALLTYDPEPPSNFDGPVIYDLGGHPTVVDATGTVVRRSFLPLGRLAWGRRREIAAGLRKIGARCVMAEFGGMGVEIMKGAQQADVPLFVHFHGYDATSHLRFPKIVRSYRRLFQNCTGIFTPSQFIADKLIGIGCPPDIIRVAACGVNMDSFPPSSRIPGRCLAVGRLVDKKAPLKTLAAFLEAAGNHPEARLDLVGDGPLMAACRELAATSPQGSQVTFHGNQPHEKVRELMRTASVFLQHSVTAPNGDCEGLPVAILEAMCSELSVVSTRHSGIPEAVEEGVSGLLVDEGDTAAMTAALGRVLDDPEFGKALGRAARLRVQDRFTIERTSAILRDGMNLPDIAGSGTTEKLTR
jgi:colanic acid/amylovoran biosynthesis glycosyltransferase|tara:strand:- start:786 stop:1940 length:1155 start_codon:yes stop_codon:yes gene_type:complete